MEQESSSVLIVDDEPIGLGILAALLEEDGYQVRTASNGPDGLAQVHEQPPDLILLDVIMPGMDGFQFCRILRSAPGIAEIPLVMLTALGDQESRLRGFEAGADDFISKPYDRDELRARVRVITRLNRYRRLLAEQQKVAFLSQYDPLTGLPNRKRFMHKLEHRIDQAQLSGQGVGLLVFSVAGIRRANDALGREVGDQLLTDMVQRIQDRIGPQVGFGRLGGSEFAIALDDPGNGEEAGRVAALLARECNAPLKVSGHELHLHSNIGVSLFPQDGRQAEQLVKLAQTALVGSVASPNSVFQFSSAEGEHRARERLELETELRHAVAQGDLVTWFQPKISLHDGYIPSMEALVRWRRDAQPPVLPGKFIALAEEIGLILPIGKQVMENACLQCAHWNQDGFPDLQVSVNVSGLQFRDPDFLQTVHNALRQSGLPPGNLELELTETQLTSTSESQHRNILDKLNRLKGIGVRLAIDDFGTGYSSLSRLRRFPVDVLKIDRSFVTELPQDTGAAAVVVTVRALAHTLHLEMVAEGVENQAQMEFLRGAGCDQVQGFLFSPAVPPEKMSILLRETPFPV